MKIILVIEDDRPVRAGIVAVLRRHGFAVLDTGLGAEGLSLAIAHRPDLILSDINLPGLNGMDVLKQLRARPEIAAIPVVLMTGETHKADARSSMMAGADDYLPKPFSMDQLLATMRARLDRQNNIQHALDAQNHANLIGAEEKIRLQTSALEAAANGIAITDRNGKIL
jgi:DNA-binding response OmpR family regulator